MYAVISFSHKNTEVALREQLHFNERENIALLKMLANIEGILESMLLATCNRCEIYVYIDSAHDSMGEAANNKVALLCQKAIATLAHFKNLDSKVLENNAHIMLQSHAIHHVFCVASSLFSVVVGETQISGQMKAAYKLSYDNNVCGKALTRLLHFAFRCAAQVRTLTDISKNPVSVASIAVNLGLEYIAHEAHTDAQKKERAKILVVGVGEMGLLCVKNLIKHDVALTLCNRTMENAKNLLREHTLEEKVTLLPFEDLKTRINEYDMAFFAVAGGTLITEDMLVKNPKKRVFFDLSIPRNLAFDSAQVRALGYENLQVICVDDLKNKAASHINARKESAKMAMGIVGQFVLDFEHWLSGLGVNPVIKAMRNQAKLASIKEIERAIKKGFIPEALRDNVAKLLHSAFNEFLHAPTMKIKAMADDETADSILEAIGNVFGAQDRILLNRYKCEYDTTKQES